jgi:hypothetical protein
LDRELIRCLQATWESSLDQLKTDPRFTGTVLPIDQQFRLFNEHAAALRAKHLDGLHALFEAHARELSTPFSELPIESLSASLPAAKLGLDERGLEEAFARWQRERTHAARLAFDEMLRENAFVEFWGRLGKLGGEGVDGGVQRDDEGVEDEGEAGGGNVDMKMLAKTVDLSDMEKVLKVSGHWGLAPTPLLTVLQNDRRYTMFNHTPEQREQWLRVSVPFRVIVALALSRSCRTTPRDFPRQSFQYMHLSERYSSFLSAFPPRIDTFASRDIAQSCCSAWT